MVGPYREKLWPRPEYADLGPEASVIIFRPRSQFFPIWASQPVNNIYLLNNHACIKSEQNRVTLKKVAVATKIQFLKNSFKEHLNQIRYNVKNTHLLSWWLIAS